MSNTNKSAFRGLLDVATPKEAFFFGLGMAVAGMATWGTEYGPWLVGYGVVVATFYAIYYVQTGVRGSE